jgi:YD repeat-containing protein
LGVVVAMALAFAGCGGERGPEPLPEAPVTEVEVPPGADGEVDAENEVEEEGTCVPTVVTAEAIPEPEGGWDAAARPPALYEEPEHAAPFGLMEPVACVADGRPRLDTWCERRIYNWDGRLSSVTRRQAAEGAKSSETHGCDSAGVCARPQDSRRYDARGRLVSHGYWDAYRDSYVQETWTWAEDGWLERFVDDEQHHGVHSVTSWQLQRACDGRPSHYEVVGPAGPVKSSWYFTYDAQGRLTQELTRWEHTRRAWDAEGRLRAEDRRTSNSSSDTRTTTYFDTAGRPVMTYEELNGRMGTREQWQWDERGPGGEVLASRRLWSYGLNRSSTLTRSAYDAEGRQVLAWSTSKGGEDGRSTGRSAQRWTYVCGTSDLAVHERDDGGDGTVNFHQTWTWDAQARKVVERSSQSPSTHWTEYHFDCSR